MKKLALCLAMLVALGPVWALEIETDSFDVIRTTAAEKAKKYGAKNVLVVLDIDNTVLTMPQNLGSDQWFGWQEENCLAQEKTPSFCVADNFTELLDIQGQIFALSNMLPTELATVSAIKEMQQNGHKVILLTSRGPDFRNATERALAMNGLSFKESAIGPAGGYPSTYIPYTLENPKKYGLDDYDVKTAGLGKARPVSYMNGVYMTSGLNKGIMLKTLLAKTKENFKAVIFADDHKKHTVRMEAIMGKVKGLDLVSFRYSKIDPVVKAFHQSDKKETIEAWTKLQKAAAQALR